MPEDEIEMPEKTKRLLEELEEERRKEEKIEIREEKPEEIKIVEDKEVKPVGCVKQTKKEDYGKQKTLDGENIDIVKKREQVGAKELIDTEISPEMRDAYLNYAMSVIVARALPAAEDGLKPVHRRILWAMHQMGIFHNKQTKKSARIVGDTMGKYHPHGDAAIYDAMVRLAQPWSMRYPLIIGQGNFGSMDGDSAAAMRYTEAKMGKISDELLEFIEKENIPMRDNFDNTMKEPEVLPGKIPALLLNGASGIAVGMATNIPPHNMNNVCDTILHYIDNPECEMKELAKKVKGPDFPTGGTISGNIEDIYKTGKGKVIVDGTVEIEEAKKKNSVLKVVITEIPYLVNKAELVEQIANQVRDKKLPDVRDIRDESSKGKVRIVIELRKGTDPKFTINRIYKYTNLRTSFNANMLALVGQKPQLLNIKQIVGVYVSHRQEVIKKTKEYDLDKAEKRLHLVKGLLIAQKNIDEIIKLIRKSKLKSEALEGLIKKYDLSQKQAESILEMRLSSLTSLEVEKLEKEESELEKVIERLNKILANPEEILKLIKKDLEELKEKYGDTRRTKIKSELKEFCEEDLVDKRDVVVSITDKGYIKRIDVCEYRKQKRGGKGVIGSVLTENDFVSELIHCSTHDYLLFFTDKGKVHWLKAHQVPSSAKSTKGRAIINLLDIKDESVTSVIAVKEFQDYLMMATEKGVIKKIKLSAFDSPRKGGIKAIKVVETNDRLISVKRIKEKEEVLLVSKDGQAIRFKESEVREMGRASYGVTGIKLREKDSVVGLEVIPATNKDKFTILTITEKGYGKRSEIEDYRLTGRAGKGVINMKVSEKTGYIVRSTTVSPKDDIIVTTQKGMTIRTQLTKVRVMGRATQGVRIIHLKEEDSVSDLVRVPEEQKI